jgi:hypothetical protein
MSQVLTHAEWDERAIEIFQKNQSRPAIVDKLQFLLKAQSPAFLVDVLNQPNFHPLRIGAFHAIRVSRPESELTCLLLLLANSHHAIVLYEPEFELLQKILATEKTGEIRKFMSWNFEGDKRSILTLVLRAIPDDQLWTLLEERDETPITAASNLSAVIERLCGLIPNWREHQGKLKILSAMEDIKESPGWSQVILLEHYPFQNDSDALKHLRAVFEDPSLPDPVAILSAKRFYNFVLSSQNELERGKNSELVSSRLVEFKKRFSGK